MEKGLHMWYVPPGVASPIVNLSDIVADLTGIDFPITAARIDKLNTSTNLDGSAIRNLGIEQPVSNEDALFKTVKWHLATEYGEEISGYSKA